MDSSRQNLYFSYMSRTTRTRRHPNTDQAIPAFVLYGEPLAEPAERLIHVETIAARSQRHDWHIRAHRHADLYQILLIRRGGVRAQLDHQTLQLTPPAALIVPPGLVHGFEFEPDTEGLVISFAVDLCAELVGADEALRARLNQPHAGPIHARTLATTDLWPLGQMLLREFGRAAHSRQSALRGLLAALLANLHRLSVSATMLDGHPSAARELVARFRERIESRLVQRAGIGRYAMDLGVSAVRLRRACLAVTGYSPIQLVQRRLLLEAERQLRYTSMPISQVAYHLGFEDPAYFSRFFTRATGFSPRTFRLRDGLETSPSTAL